jgi:hypothetical protein
MSYTPDIQHDISHVSGAARGHARRASLRRRAVTDGLSRGFAGGVVATVAMSTVMLVAQKAGLLGQMPPKKISERLLATVGARRKTPKPARELLATVLHFTFGGAAGAVFGVAHGVWRTRARGSSSASRTSIERAPLLAGLAFGSAIWAVSYAGWVPALRIMPMPHADRRGRPTSMLVAHWVFGAALAKLVAR